MGGEAEAVGDVRRRRAQRHGPPPQAGSPGNARGEPPQRPRPAQRPGRYFLQSPPAPRQRPRVEEPGGCGGSDTPPLPWGLLAVTAPAWLSPTEELPRWGWPAAAALPPPATASTHAGRGAPARWKPTPRGTRTPRGGARRCGPPRTETREPPHPRTLPPLPAPGGISSPGPSRTRGEAGEPPTPRGGAHARRLPPPLPLFPGAHRRCRPG